VGVRAHTFLQVLSLPREGIKPPGISPGGRIVPMTPPYSGYNYETPQSLACVYNLVPQTGGCNPNTATALPTPAKPSAIAVVVAYDNPTALSDLQTFAAQFGLPDPTNHFQVVYVSGKPVASPGWALEATLDIEYSYAMSPTAMIYLVEAHSNSYSDLTAAVTKAASLVAAAGGGVVLQNWGGTEFAAEAGAAYDGVYAKASPSVTFLATTGDTPGVSWPATSPYVVAVGGTSVSRNPNTGNFETEMTWQQSGGGISAYEPRPAFQNSVSAVVGKHRGTPDIAADADPNTGAWVYSNYDGSGWSNIVGGTSLAGAVSAGILSWKGVKTTAQQQILNGIYTSSAFRDITSGNCGPYAGLFAKKGYDLCTGMGSIDASATPLVVAGSFAP
jgi:subtilase family serine protease